MRDLAAASAASLLADVPTYYLSRSPSSAVPATVMEDVDEDKVSDKSVGAEWVERVARPSEVDPGEARSKKRIAVSPEGGVSPLDETKSDGSGCCFCHGNLHRDNCICPKAVQHRDLRSFVCGGELAAKKATRNLRGLRRRVARHRHEAQVTQAVGPPHPKVQEGQDVLPACQNRTHSPIGGVEDLPPTTKHTRHAQCRSLDV
jgi:hypothetical protein